MAINKVNKEKNKVRRKIRLGKKRECVKVCVWHVHCVHTES